jgi:hypothetical protein
MPFVSPNFQDASYELKSIPKPKIVKPMANPKALSPVLIASMIRSAATPGSGVTQASLLSLVISSTVMTYGTHAASFEKERPGVYVVSYYLEGTMVDQVQAANTAEAKSLVIEYLVNAAREEIAKEKQNA